MSTLNEIAANHARMAKAQAQESTVLIERHVQVVGSIEVPSPEGQQHLPLHLMAGAQESQLGQVPAY